MAYVGAPSGQYDTNRDSADALAGAGHLPTGITLAPLSDWETAALVSQLLGPIPSVGALGQTIAEGAAGNPFFAEEMQTPMT
ncbi:MAG TPA: hypothetical protein VEF72_30970 [Mycobacterium sp.]|nr:hypothetical protein [Mycobacterium sp.]